jgi:transcriptional regulator with XRE-family HTH domain
MARGLYQNLTAELAGITKGMLSSFETGRRTPIVYTLTKPIRAGLETLSVGLATGRPPWDGLVRKLRLGPRQEAAAGERPLL